MYTLDKQLTPLLKAVLAAIRGDLNRRWFNKYQKEMFSPFDNTGAYFRTPIFEVRAYQWDLLDDDTIANETNFSWKGLRVYWYKYYTRGLEATCDEPITPDLLNTMLCECLDSLENEFPEDWDL